MKNFFSFCFIVLFIGICSTSYANDMSCEQDYTKAIYQIVNTQQKTQTQLILLRTTNKVAHHYPATEITESWELNQVKTIKPTRYFDHYKRAIEYQPTELVHGKIEKDWSYRYQLVSDDFLKKAKLIAQQYKGCELEESLQYKSADLSYRISYLPQKRLISKFEVSTLDGNIIETWTLTDSTHEQETVQAFFAAKDDFQSTDFADIGDDHTDPFLTKMVTLGFIEASSSGFYHADDKGNVSALGQHQH
jgi:hypothetical protein